MKAAILVIHLIVAISLTTLILLQSSKGGLGAAFGGGEYYRTKRGAERVIFTATIIMAALFLVTSIINLILH